MSKYKLESGPDVDLEVEDVRDSKGRRITREYVEKAVADLHEHVARPSVPDRLWRALAAGIVPCPGRAWRVDLPAGTGDALEKYVEHRKTS